MPQIDGSGSLQYNKHVEHDSLTSRLNQYLAKHQLKSTRQREVILDVLCAHKQQHVGIEKVWEEARKINPQIGYATVYRTLMLLVEAGLAQQRHFSSGQSLFELATEDHHDHLICTECGKIFEFENDTIESLQERIAKKFSFHLTSHKMELYGICLACRRKTVETHAAQHK